MQFCLLIPLFLTDSCQWHRHLTQNDTASGFNLFPIKVPLSSSRNFKFHLCFRGCLKGQVILWTQLLISNGKKSLGFAPSVRLLGDLHICYGKTLGGLGHVFSHLWHVWFFQNQGSLTQIRSDREKVFKFSFFQVSLFVSEIGVRLGIQVSGFVFVFFVAYVIQGRGQCTWGRKVLIHRCK